LPKDAEEDMGQEKRAIFNDMGQEPHFKRAIRVFNHHACTENQYSRQVQKHTTISSTSCVEYDGPGMERNRQPNMKSLRELFANYFHTPSRDVLVWFLQPILFGFVSFTIFFLFFFFNFNTVSFGSSIGLMS
jgi:hypothetical protein